MDSRRWKTITALFEEASGLPEGERQGFLQRADVPADVRNEVAAMLRAAEDEGALAVESILSTEDEASPVSGNAPVTKSPLSRSALLGSRIGPYRLTDVLGKGGMGVVYRGERESPYRQSVAVKLLRATFLTEDATRRFEVERQILARLDHPQIARLLDGGQSESGQPYLVMELVEGEAITRHCERNALPLRQRLQLFRRVCETVQFAHRNLVVHRDLKPSNILVTAEGHVKLLDFGIAKLLMPEVKSDAMATRTELRVMTPAYATPEQIRGEAITTATDVYGLGTLLYQLLTGRLPHGSTTDPSREVERRVCDEDPDPMSHGDGPRVNRDLEAIVRKALRREPSRRYQSAEELSADVDRWMRSLPITARPDSRRYRLGRFAVRHRVGLTVSGGIALLLMASAVALLFQGQQVSRQRDVARQQRDRSDQVVDLLVDLFRGSNPTIVPGADTLRVAQFLDMNQAQTLAGLDDQPQLQIEMKRVFAAIQTSRSQFDSAFAMLQSASQQEERLSGTEGATYAQLRHLMARNRAQVLAPGAIEGLRESLARLRRVHGDRHLDVAQAMKDLGERCEDPQERIDLLEQALAIMREVSIDGEQLADVTNSLAMEHWRRQDFKGAADLFEQALSHFQKKHPPTHPHALALRQNRASALMNLNRLDEAARAFEQIATDQRQLLGDSEPLIATLQNLGVALTKDRDFREAESAFRQAAQVARQIFGSDHRRVADLERNVAHTVLFREEYEKAHQEFLKAARTSRAADGDGPRTWYIEALAANLLVDLGRHEAARNQLDSLVERLKAATPDDDSGRGYWPARRIWEPETYLGRAMLRSTSPGSDTVEQAQTHFRAAMERWKQSSARDPSEIAAAEGGLGLALLERGRAEEAKSVLVDAYERYRQRAFAHPGIVGELRAGVAQLPD